MTEIVKKSRVTQSSVNGAVLKASQQRTSKETRQQRRARERQQSKMNSMISRKEAVDLIRDSLKSADDIVKTVQEQNRLLFIQVKTLTNLVLEKGITSQEELDQIAKKAFKSIYDPEEDTEEGKKDES